MSASNHMIFVICNNHCLIFDKCNNHKFTQFSSWKMLQTKMYVCGVIRWVSREIFQCLVDTSWHCHVVPVGSSWLFIHVLDGPDLLGKFSPQNYKNATKQLPTDLGCPKHRWTAWMSRRARLQCQLVPAQD